MRFLKFFISTLAAAFCTLGIIFLLFRKGYNAYHACEQSRLHEIIEGKSYYDALFIGSSRTYSHINPRVIDSVLNITSFNAGINGANLLETNLILKCFLASHPKPKYVIADLSHPAFDVNESAVFNPNIYYPFLGNKIVYETLGKFKRVALLKYLPFLQITECDDNLKQAVLAGLLGKKEPNTKPYHGYVGSSTDTLTLPFKPYFLKHYFAVSKKGTDLLEEMIDICKQNDIRLFVTYSPVYYVDEKKLNHTFFPTVRNICAANLVSFLNYRHLPLNKDHRLFSDEHHLNNKGAEIFSSLLAHDIKNAEMHHWNLHPGHQLINQR